MSQRKKDDGDELSLLLAVVLIFVCGFMLVGVTLWMSSGPDEWADKCTDGGNQVVYHSGRERHDWCISPDGRIVTWRTW